MSLTSTEQGLLGSLIGLFAGGAGVFFGARSKVPKTECKLKHDGLDKLITTQLEAIGTDIKEIKEELRLVRGIK